MLSLDEREAQGPPPLESFEAIAREGFAVKRDSWASSYAELRFSRWSEIDLDAAMWTVPAARMKRELPEKLHDAPHLVPLPKQAVAALRELHTITRAARLGGQATARVNAPTSAFVGFTLIWIWMS